MAGGEAFVLEHGWAADAGGDTVCTPTTPRCMAEESTQGLGAGSQRNTAPAFLSQAGEERIHIRQGDMFDVAIL